MYSDRLLIFLLLFVNNTKTKIYFITFAVIRIDVEDIGECFFSVVEGRVSIVQ